MSNGSSFVVICSRGKGKLNLFVICFWEVVNGLVLWISRKCWWGDVFRGFIYSGFWNGIGVGVEVNVKVDLVDNGEFF